MNKVVPEQRQASTYVAKAGKGRRSGVVGQSQRPCTWLMPAPGYPRCGSLQGPLPQSVFSHEVST